MMIRRTVVGGAVAVALAVAMSFAHPAAQSAPKQAVV
jgi:hypothetical protein